MAPTAAWVADKVEGAIESVEKKAVDLEHAAVDLAKQEMQTVEEHEKEAFSSAEELGSGAIAKLYEHHQVDWLALRLLRNHMVFSKSWRSDLWLHMKNKQIFVSIFLAHPKHPFRRRERLCAVLVSCLLAWGMECWFCVHWTSCRDHSEKDFITLFLNVLLLKIVISAVGNGVYDAVLENAMTCGCVQEGCTDFVKNSCEKLSLVQFWLQLAGALIILGYGLFWIISAGRWDHFGTALQEMVVGKLVGLLVVTMLLEILGFTLGRRAQMKPSGEEALKKWDAPTKGCCGASGPAPNKLWNKFIGPKKSFEDLPELAPTYDIDVKICGVKVYSERAAERSKIPRCFRRSKATKEVRPAEQSPVEDLKGTTPAEDIKDVN